MPASHKHAAQKQRRRQLGAFYTPAEIVRFMFRCCMTDLIEGNRGEFSSPLTVLDPACGDGAFLIGAATMFSEMTTHGWQGQQRSGWPWILTPHCAGPSAALLTPAPDNDSCGERNQQRLELYGVDVDARAIAVLNRRLSAESSRQRVQIVCGNALTGPALDEEVTANPSGLDWSQAFPDVAAAGGYDLVIGNPPYLREKDAKALFDRIAASPLGKRWRQPRMDLWHYFVHRGLDLLKPGGVLSFIVNSYWTSATGARRLTRRLQDETTLQRIVLLGDEPIFDGVSGRHMILQLRKECRETECRVLDMTATTDVLSALDRMTASDEQPHAEDGTRVWTRPQHSLYDAGRLIVAPESHRPSQRHREKRLSDHFVVRQGIAENPPFVTRRMLEESGGTQPTGSGVFVLTGEEVAALELSSGERSLLRPYFATAAICRYALPAEPTHWLLYLTRQTAPEITQLPAIKRHLEQFRATLERRREVRKDAIAWWHLHWPRRESLFTQPRILAVQMGRRPTFAYAERPTFVGFSVNVVQSAANRDQASFSLPALTAMLNSRLAAEWFTRHAKHRGVHLDISGTVLRDFPLPLFDESVDRKLRTLCLRQQSSLGAVVEDDLEREIDRMVDALYEPASIPDAPRKS